MNQRGLAIALIASFLLTAGLVASGRWQASEPRPCVSQVGFDTQEEEVDNALHHYRTQQPKHWRSCVMQQ